jgi:predicted outer membrane repeat protein
VLANNSVSGYGGALYLDTGSSLTASSASFENNTADMDGGAVYHTGGAHPSGATPSPGDVACSGPGPCPSSFSECAGTTALRSAGHFLERG